MALAGVPIVDQTVDQNTPGYHYRALHQETLSSILRAVRCQSIYFFIIISETFLSVSTSLVLAFDCSHATECRCGI